MGRTSNGLMLSRLPDTWPAIGGISRAAFRCICHLAADTMTSPLTTFWRRHVRSFRHRPCVLHRDAGNELGHHGADPARIGHTSLSWCLSAWWTEATLSDA